MQQLGFTHQDDSWIVNFYWLNGKFISFQHSVISEVMTNWTNSSSSCSFLLDSDIWVCNLGGKLVIITRNDTISEHCQWMMMKCFGKFLNFLHPIISVWTIHPIPCYASQTLTTVPLFTLLNSYLNWKYSNITPVYVNDHHRGRSLGKEHIYILIRPSNY